MKRIFLLLTLLICKNLIAQEPTLSGTVKISIEKGIIDCELTLSNIPSVEDYGILINTGMNIKYFRNPKLQKNLDYVKNYKKDISYESFLYSFQEKKPIPKKIEFKYLGKFPVFNDTLKSYKKGDWRGNIAFGNSILRMDGVQSNWYPVIYDSQNDKIYDAVKYNIKIICEDCTTLYVNGNVPIHSNKNTFSSDKPVEIFVFVGKYDFYNINGTYFLNPDIDKSGMKKISKITQQFKNYYSAKLGISYNKNINYVQTLPTTTKNAFSFIAYPTIINVGREYGLKSFANEKNTSSRTFLAHELAHYYFGSGYKKFNSVIYGVIQEGFAEYMAYQASMKFLGTEVYKNKLEKTLANLDKSKLNFIPISKIDNENDLKNYYRYAYDYFPIVLLAIQREIGQKKMWQWMKNLLTTEVDLTDYKFLKNGLIQAIENTKKSSVIIEKYFTSDNSLKNAIEILKNE